MVMKRDYQRVNNFDDVYALNRDERQISNLETYRRFISKGDKPLECINDEDAKAIKDGILFHYSH